MRLTAANSGNNGAPFVDKNYCGRSTLLLTFWYPMFANAHLFVVRKRSKGKNVCSSVRPAGFFHSLLSNQRDSHTRTQAQWLATTKGYGALHSVRRTFGSCSPDAFAHNEIAYARIDSHL